MMKPFNRNILVIILFEGFLSGGTMEWISEWAEDFKSALWGIFGVYAFLMLGIGFLLIVLMRRIPEEFVGCTIFDYFLGQRVGAIFNLLLFAALMIFTVKVLLTGVALIHYTTLPYSPRWILVLFALMIPMQMLVSGMDAMVRFQAVIFWPALILATILLLISFRTSDFRNLLPVLPTVPLGRLIPRLSESLFGLALLVIYLPLFKSRGVSFQSLKRGFFIAAIGIVMWRLLNLLVALSILGPFETAALRWPVLEAVRLQKIPGIFLERLDLIFLLPVLVAVVSAVNIYLFGAYHVFSYYRKNHRSGPIIAIAIIALVSFFSPSLYVVSDIYASTIGWFDVILICLIPIMYLTSTQRHAKGTR